MQQRIKVLIGIVVVICIILICVLVPISFHTLEPNEAALAYDAVNYKIDTSTLYEEGRYYLVLGRSFKKFPYIFLC